jgi:amidase
MSDESGVSDLVKRSATWMARALRAREVSCVELLDAHAERFEARHEAINAIVLPRFEAAREEASAADAAIARGEPLGPLHGVPFTVKEVIGVAGMPTTNGSLLLADQVASSDAEVVRRMRRAGAILLGKTNLSEFSAFWDSVNASTVQLATRTTARVRPVDPRAARPQRWQRR